MSKQFYMAQADRDGDMGEVGPFLAYDEEGAKAEAWRLFQECWPRIVYDYAGWDDFVADCDGSLLGTITPAEALVKMGLLVLPDLSVPNAEFMMLRGRSQLIFDGGNSALAQAYQELTEGLVDMVSNQRLTEADIPDDFAWLDKMLGQLVLLCGDLPNDNPIPYDLNAVPEVAEASLISRQARVDKAMAGFKSTAGTDMSGLSEASNAHANETQPVVEEQSLVDLVGEVNEAAGFDDDSIFHFHTNGEVVWLAFFQTNALVARVPRNLVRFGFLELAESIFKNGIERGKVVGENSLRAELRRALGAAPAVTG